MTETTTIEIRTIRRAMANYIRSEGCSCCRGGDHEKHLKRIARLLSVPKYDGLSGYNFYQFTSKGKD